MSRYSCRWTYHVGGGQRHWVHEILGESIDDAAGECPDKAAKMLELPYPGGPNIARLAQTGNPLAYELPRPMLGKGLIFLSVV